MPTPDASNFKDALKQQADIVRIVGDYVRLKKSGGQNFSGLCPFHNEKTPSFSVHATRQFYHCFGCGESGDVFTFIQKVENITFPEAVRLIAQKLGVPMPKMTFSSPTEARDAQLRMALLDVHARAVAFFQESFRRPEGANAREYLKSRGLDSDTIARFQIGYAPDSGFALKDALRREFDEELLRDSGLFSWKEGSRHPQENLQPTASGNVSAVSRQPEPPEINAFTANSSEKREPGTGNSPPPIYSKFRNRVMFPIANDQGKTIAFTGRTLSTDDKAGPKYLNSPETAIYSKSRVLFNLDHAKEAIRKLDYAILVEGQMDCISVFAAGFHNVIASSGTAFTEIQARLLGRFSKKVVVNFDPDTAGARATERTLGMLVEEEFEIRVLTLEAGFDPDLFIRRQGKDAYAAALKASQKYFDYLIDRARALFPARNPENKVKAVNHLLPHIQRVPSRIVRDELAMEISQKLGIDSAVLRQELKHAATDRAATQVKASAETQITGAERVLIRALASAQGVGSGSNSNSDAEADFDAARQAQFALQAEHLYEGLASQSLIEALLLSAAPSNQQSGEPFGERDGERAEGRAEERTEETAAETAHFMSLPKSEGDKRLLAAILMHEEEDLTPETVEGAVKALRRIYLRRRLEEVQIALQRQGASTAEKQALLQEKVRLKRALMAPGLGDAA